MESKSFVLSFESAFTMQSYWQDDPTMTITQARKCNLNHWEKMTSCLPHTPHIEKSRWSGENPIHTWLRHSTVQATMGAFLSFMWHWASKVSKVQEAYDFYLKIYKLWKWMPLCLFVLHSTLKSRGLLLLASCQPISTPQKPWQCCHGPAVCLT